MTAKRHASRTGSQKQLDRQGCLNRRRTRIDERLAAYSTVAAAVAAVGGQSASAGLMINDFPDVHLQNNLDEAPIDIDGDMLGDFSFYLGVSRGTDGALDSAGVFAEPYAAEKIDPEILYFNGLVGNVGQVFGNDYSFPYALNAGEKIFATDTLLYNYVGFGSVQVMALFSEPDTSYGNWKDGKAEGFVGVLFDINKKDHLGFVQISIENRFATNPFAVTIHGAGWNDIPIGTEGGNELTLAKVPEPSSLAVLALGAAGVLMRRRRSAAVASRS